MTKRDKNKDAKEFGERLKAVRSAKGITLTGLSVRLGTTTTRIARLEAGLVNPVWSTVLRLAVALDCGTEDFRTTAGKET